jgi:hypothetical protein
VSNTRVQIMIPLPFLLSSEALTALQQQQKLLRIEGQWHTSRLATRHADKVT